MRKLILLSCTFVMSTSFAANVKFQDIQLQGRGCGEQNASVVFSPDQTQASVLFDELLVQVPSGGMDDFSDAQVSSIVKTIDRKVCNMTVKLDVPAQERVVGVEFITDFRGIAVGDKGTEAELDSRIISWNDRIGSSQTSSTVIFNKLFRGSFDEELYETNTNYIAVNSGCNGSSTSIDFVIRNTLRAEVMKKAKDLPTAVLAIDSSDMSGNFKIKLHTQKCNQTSPTQPTRPTRPTRPGRVDRDKIELCRQMGGVWHEKQGTCIQVFGRR